MASERGRHIYRPTDIARTIPLRIRIPGPPEPSVVILVFGLQFAIPAFVAPVASQFIDGHSASAGRIDEPEDDVAALRGNYPDSATPR